MTTATPGSPTSTVGSVLRGALTSTLVVGAATVALGALASGRPAAVGAAIGIAMVCVFFGTGAVVLEVVARVAPAASLLIALLTYTLTVVLVGLVFAALDRSGVLGGSVDAQWLGGAVIAGTLAWLAALVTLSMRARQPLYDLPSQGPEASAR